MTTIAYRDGVLVSDTGLTAGGTRLGRIVKIAKGKRGELAGACGDATFNAAFLQWVRGGRRAKPPRAQKSDGSCDIGVVFFSGNRFEIHEPGGVFETTAPYFALGSGKPEALGAMFAGGSAELALRAAMEHDTGTFGDIAILRHRHK